MTKGLERILGGNGVVLYLDCSDRYVTRTAY